jgi:hypothetical protein
MFILLPNRRKAIKKKEKKNFFWFFFFNGKRFSTHASLSICLAYKLDFAERRRIFYKLHFSSSSDEE